MQKEEAEVLGKSGETGGGSGVEGVGMTQAMTGNSSQSPLLSLARPSRSGLNTTPRKEWRDGQKVNKKKNEDEEGELAEMQK